MTGERKRRYQSVEDFLRTVRSMLPAKPTAILIATAHWEPAAPSFTGAGQPELIYDYYGFPPETYELQYGAPGHPGLAERASALLRKAGHPAEVDPHRGWDHGVFIPLKVMFPDADIPVVAMSLHASLDPALRCELGAALRSLRDEGVLIVGAGMSYHNLGNFVAAASASYQFHDWLDGALSGDWAERTQRLARWSGAPGGAGIAPAGRAPDAADDCKWRRRRLAGAAVMAGSSGAELSGCLGFRLEVAVAGPQRQARAGILAATQAHCGPKG